MSHPDEGGSTSRCYECEREVERRNVLTREVVIHHDEGLGYEEVPVPLCRGCVADLFGETCNECGEDFLDVDAYNEHYLREHRNRGRPIADGGENFLYYCAACSTMTVEPCAECPACGDDSEPKTLAITGPEDVDYQQMADDMETIREAVTPDERGGR